MRNETITLVDDLDNSDGAKKRKFMLDGVEYEIDLSEPNWERLKSTLAVYMESGRRIPRRRKSTGATQLARAKKD